MLKRSAIPYILTLIVVDTLITLLALRLAQLLRLTLPIGANFTPAGQLSPLSYAMVVIIWPVSFAFLNAYDPNHLLRFFRESQLVARAVLVSILVFSGGLYFVNRELSRWLVVYFFILDLSLVLLGRLIVRLTFQALKATRFPQRGVLIVGAGRIGRQIAAHLTEHDWMGLCVTGYLDDDPKKVGQVFNGVPVLGTLDDASRVIRDHPVQEVVIALPLQAHNRLASLVAQLQETAVNIKVAPDFFTLSFIRPTLDEMAEMPLIGLKDPVLSPGQRLTKRTFDLVVAITALILLSPLLLLIALLIKLDSRGPVFFCQQRIGENGQSFRIIKFRTMGIDAEEHRDLLWVTRDDGKKVFLKRPDDPRITRLGHFLRRTSLDELPQLFNIIKGEMSLVGPRPELPDIVAQYEPWQRKRFAVPAGLTGWWQVNGRSDRPMHLHTEDDLYYIRNYSLFLDLLIIWRTVGAVIRGRGAY